ncbi:response regulator [Gottschalkia purinilytica]|uniref:Response regulator n=1 Tax=Gottschalkia purinilytica TaxID=1503 RepID=A0A0L0WDW3_GOTPU|nr:response regulator [Gottschalkia purinilytica]KNF09626.1 response regulator [Gottschalkia purinilytica]
MCTNELPKFENIEALVVDDMKEVGKTIGSLLTVLGINSDIENYSSKVESLIKEKEYDIIVCDLAMPVLNGIEVSRIVKSYNKDIKFILMTGWPDDIKNENLETVDVMLQKPCTLEVIASTIDSLINHPT